MKDRRLARFLAGVIFATVAALSGCYTILKHPDIGKGYAEEEEYLYVRNHCGECHAVYVSPYLPPPPPISHRRWGNEDESTEMRSIDSSQPIRRPLGITGSPSEFPGSQGSTEGKAEEASEKEKSDSTKKKQVPKEHKPVKRDTEKETKKTEEKSEPEKKKE